MTSRYHSTGTTQPCYCSGCRNTFASISAFDSHRGTRGAHGECRDVGAVPGLELRDGMWGQRRAEVTR